MGRIVHCPCMTMPCFDIVTLYHSLTVVMIRTMRTMITSEDSVWIYKDFCLWWGLVDIKVGAFGNEIKADYSDDDDDDDGGDNDNNDDDKGNDDDDYADENSDGYDDDDSDDNDHLAALYMNLTFQVTFVEQLSQFLPCLAVISFLARHTLNLSRPAVV